MTDKLKPCPRCEGEPEFITTIGHDEWVSMIRCKKLCGFKIPCWRGTTMQHAQGLWNRASKAYLRKIK